MEKTKKRAVRDILLHEHLRARKLISSDRFKKALKEWQRGELEKMCGFCIPPTFTRDDLLKALDFSEDDKIRWLLWNTHEQIINIISLRKPKAEVIKGQEDEQKITDPGFVDDNGYIHIKVKATPEIEGKNINQNVYLQLFKEILDTYVFSNTQNNRLRKEEAEAYRVWEAWSNSGVSSKKGFKQIADKFGCKVNTVKARWYRAYKLIYGVPYKLVDFKESGRDKALLLCAKCNDATCYRSRRTDWIPCRKFIDIAGRDYLREMTTDKFESLEGTASYKEWSDSQFDPLN